MATNSNKKPTKNTQPRILNKRATYDYAIEERYEAGLSLIHILQSPIVPPNHPNV